jgi:hypothetical protein
MAYYTDDNHYFHEQDVIDTRQALPPVPSDNLNDLSVWRDEIHPSSKSFAHITHTCFIPRLRQLGII